MSLNHDRTRWGHSFTVWLSTGIFEEGMFGIWNDSDFMTFVVDYPEDKMDNNSFSRMAMRQNRLVGIIFVS